MMDYGVGLAADEPTHDGETVVNGAPAFGLAGELWGLTYTSEARCGATLVVGERGSAWRPMSPLTTVRLS